MSKSISGFLLAFLCVWVSNAQGTPTDYLSADFHKQRRDEVRKLLPPNTAVVLFANAERNRANDVDYVYHQDPNFYYLTGYHEPNAVLVMFSEMQTDASGTPRFVPLFLEVQRKAMPSMPLVVLVQVFLDSRWAPAML